MNEYIDFFENIITVFAALFTPQQQLILFLITMPIMSLTQVFKFSVPWVFTEKRPAWKRAKIHGFAFLIGILCSIVGYIISTVNEPLWFWLFTGVCSGMGAIGIFKLVIELPSKFKKNQ